MTAGCLDLTEPESWTPGWVNLNATVYFSVVNWVFITPQSQWSALWGFQQNKTLCGKSVRYFKTLLRHEKKKKNKECIAVPGLCCRCVGQIYAWILGRRCPYQVRECIVIIVQLMDANDSFYWTVHTANLCLTPVHLQHMCEALVNFRTQHRGQSQAFLWSFLTTSCKSPCNYHIVSHCLHFNLLQMSYISHSGLCRSQ